MFCNTGMGSASDSTEQHGEAENYAIMNHSVTKLHQDQSLPTVLLRALTHNMLVNYKFVEENSFPSP